MAGNENNLIGYDPLAWMDEGVDEMQEPQEQLSGNDTEIGQNELLDQSDYEQPVETDSPETDQDETDQDGPFIDLDAVLNIQKVKLLHEKLKKSLDANHLIVLDASAVTSIDTSMLQLFVALKQKAAKLDKDIIVNSPSDKFVQSATLLGLSEILDIET
jgi:anti-anti-sigma regulatory factor